MINSVVEAVANMAASVPDKMCMIDELGEYTYGMVYDNIKKICCMLEREYSIKSGDTVVVECNQKAVFLQIDMACEWLGAVFVPVENKVVDEKIHDVVNEVEAALFISENEHPVDVKSLLYAEIEAYCKKMHIWEKEPDLPNGDEVAEILFTTGTTGTPKGIMLTHKNNVAIAENIIYGTQMKKDSVELIPLPISHSHGLRTCYANLVNGSTIILTEGVTRVKSIFEMIEKYGISALDLSPSAARVLIKLSKGALANYKDQIDFVQIGTAMLDEELKKQLCELLSKSRLYNFYGSTESGRVCVFDFNLEQGKSGCIGHPAKNARFVITDENRNEIESSTENMGLLAIAGAMNMKGYYKNQELTDSIMRNGYIFTNDMGYIDESGCVYVMGRADDVINYRGIKISPEEIEGPARKFPGLVDCACVPLADAMCGQVPKLFVVMESGAETTQKEITEFLREYLEDNRMPKRIRFIDSIPRTANGKILRKKLIEIG